MIAALALLLAAPLTPVRATGPVAHDADDPAIWVHPQRPEASLIIGTDKQEGTGGLYAWGLDGRERWRVTPLDRPNNVDVVERGVVVTERMARRLRLFSLRGDGQPQDVTGETAVFAHEQGEKGAPMGVAVWQPAPGRFEAVISPKESYRWRPLQRLELNWRDQELERMDARPAGRLGIYSGDPEGEIEALVIDRERGILFYADESAGLRAWSLREDRAISLFGQTGYLGDREGLAIWRRGKQVLLLSSDQIEGGSRLHVWDVSRPEAPSRIAVIPTVSDETDGLEVCAQPLGPEFPAGILVMMDSDDRRFEIYDLRAVAARL
jgi:3-phytase